MAESSRRRSLALAGARGGRRSVARGRAHAAQRRALLGHGARRRSGSRAARRTSSASIPASTSKCSSCRGRPRTRSCSPRSPARRCPTSASSATPGSPSSRRSMRSSRSMSCVARLARHRARRLLRGHPATPIVVDGTLFGIPWYVDTRLLFYRRDLLQQAGFDAPPRRGTSGREMLARSRRMVGAGSLRDPAAAQRVRAAARAGAAAARAAAARRRPLRAISAAPASAARCAFYASMFRRGLGAADDQHADLERLGRVRPRLCSRSTSPGRGTSASSSERLPPRAAGRVDDGAAAGAGRPGRVDRRRREPRRLQHVAAARPRRGS